MGPQAAVAQQRGAHHGPVHAQPLCRGQGAELALPWEPSLPFS